MMNLLGASLLGQREYVEAEPLLIRGYEGLKSREARFLPQIKKTVPEAAARPRATLQGLGQARDLPSRLPLKR